MSHAALQLTFFAKARNQKLLAPIIVCICMQKSLKLTENPQTQSHCEVIYKIKVSLINIFTEKLFKNIVMVLLLLFRITMGASF